MSSLPEADVKLVEWNSDVYEPSDDTFALVDAINNWLLEERRSMPTAELPCTCLEIGCGSGYVICSVVLALRSLHAAHRTSHDPAAWQQPPLRCFATDVSEAALEATSRTLSAHGLEGAVDLLRADLAGPLASHLAGAVDLLLFNPPYVPTPDDELDRGGIAAAWAGGHLGRRVIDRLLPQLPSLLSPRGSAFIIAVEENQPQDIMRQLVDAGLSARIALRRGADEELLHVLHVSRPQPVPNESSH